ncbi:putative short-chain dehydrogenase [Xylariaceae sp. FL0804]|nr:putative short-chain dehydrogenase [Xylariaceae sp. FL0804]
MADAAAAKGSILVTGANGGLGSAIAKQIASKPEFSHYHGLYMVRDARHAPDLASALSCATSHSHDILGLSLTDLDNVRQVTERINDRVSTGEIPPIRALVIAAGFQDFGKQTWTEDGLDTTFAANYLGHWLLTLLLLKSVDKESGRIVVVGSQSHDPDDPRNAGHNLFEDKHKPVLPDLARFTAITKGEYCSAAEGTGFRGGYRRYGASKLFLIMMQHELQARIDVEADAPSGLGRVCVVGVDPGAMRSGMQRHAGWFIRVLVFGIIYRFLVWLNPYNGAVRPTSRSAGDVLQAAFTAGEDGVPPKDRYFDGRTPLETSEESRDPVKREMVWRETVRLSGLKEGETVLTKWQ